MEEASFQRIKHKLITSTIFSKSVQLCVNNLFKIRSQDSEAIWNDLSLGEGGSAALPFSVIVSDVAHVSLCELSTNLNNPYSLMWWKPLNLLTECRRIFVSLSILIISAQNKQAYKIYRQLSLTKTFCGTRLTILQRWQGGAPGCDDEVGLGEGGFAYAQG